MGKLVSTVTSWTNNADFTYGFSSEYHTGQQDDMWDYSETLVHDWICYHHSGHWQQPIHACSYMLPKPDVSMLESLMVSWIRLYWVLFSAQHFNILSAILCSVLCSDVSLCFYFAAVLFKHLIGSCSGLLLELLLLVR